MFPFRTHEKKEAVRVNEQLAWPSGNCNNHGECSKRIHNRPALINQRLKLHSVPISVVTVKAYTVRLRVAARLSACFFVFLPISQCMCVSLRFSAVRGAKLREAFLSLSRAGGNDTRGTQSNVLIGHLSVIMRSILRPRAQPVCISVANSSCHQ